MLKRVLAEAAEGPLGFHSLGRIGDGTLCSGRPLRRARAGARFSQVPYCDLLTLLLPPHCLIHALPLVCF